MDVKKEPTDNEYFSEIPNENTNFSFVDCKIKKELEYEDENKPADHGRISNVKIERITCSYEVAKKLENEVKLQTISGDDLQNESRNLIQLSAVQKLECTPEEKWMPDEEEDEFVSHEEFTQNTELEAQIENKMNLKCNNCGKFFSDKKVLKRHVLTHSGIRNFKCNDCEKCFGDKSALRRHTLTHSGIKNFKCKECGKCFNLKSSLGRHASTHSQIKNFKCGDCGKCFNHVSYLNRHAMVHSGMKNFECTECGKCFIYKPVFNRHVLTHTGMKNFKCSDCNKSFTRKANLNQHILTEHGWKDIKIRGASILRTDDWV